jgi:hypothetical protein
MPPLGGASPYTYDYETIKHLASLQVKWMLQIISEWRLRSGYDLSIICTLGVSQVALGHLDYMNLLCMANQTRHLSPQLLVHHVGGHWVVAQKLWPKPNPTLVVHMVVIR